MEKISEMSVSQFSRLRREYGIGIVKSAPTSTYSITSKLRRTISEMSEEEFRWAKEKYGFGKNVSANILSDRMMSALERMDDQMVLWLHGRYTEGGMRELIEVMRMNFKEIRKRAGQAEQDQLKDDHIQGY